MRERVMCICCWYIVVNTNSSFHSVWWLKLNHFVAVEPYFSVEITEEGNTYFWLGHVCLDLALWQRDMWCRVVKYVRWILKSFASSSFKKYSCVLANHSFCGKAEYEASSFCSSVLESSNAEGKQKRFSSEWCAVEKHRVIRSSYPWHIKCSWACQGPKSASNLVYPDWCLCIVSSVEFQHRKWCDSLPNVDNSYNQNNFTWQCNWVIYKVLFSGVATCLGLCWHWSWEQQASPKYW